MFVKHCTVGIFVIWSLFVIFLFYISISGYPQLENNEKSEDLNRMENFTRKPDIINDKNRSMIQLQNEADRILRRGEEKPLIVWKCNARLGNHMFIHAAAYALAQQTNHTNTIATKSYVTRYFPGIKAKQISVAKVTKLFPALAVVREKGAGIYTPSVLQNITKLSHVRLHGHYQSWKYFYKYEEDLKQQFKVDPKTHSYVENLLKNLVTVKLKQNQYFKPLSDITYVGVHIRRGDVATEHRISIGIGPAPLEYIKKAMNYYRNNFKNVMFIVCSNEMMWSVINLGYAEDIIYAQDETITEFVTLTLCNHTVITTGTFGWWAGWLAGGQVVYYSKFPTPGSIMGSQYKAADYFLPHWIPMSE